RCHEVERFRGAAREDQAIAVAHAEERGDAGARIVIPLRGAHRELVRAPMRIRVVVLIELPDRIQYDARLLRRCGRIQIDEPWRRREQRKFGSGQGAHHRMRAPTQIASCSMRTWYTGNASIAGKRFTAPVRQSYRAPCHAHSMMPPGSSAPSDIANS